VESIQSVDGVVEVNWFVREASINTVRCPADVTLPWWRRAVETLLLMMMMLMTAL